MDTEKDRFGEKLRLLEHAREDIYFAAKDRELIEKLKTRLAKVESSGRSDASLSCPKCGARLETYGFMGVILDRCVGCEGIWLDKGELESVLKRVMRSPLAAFIEKLLGREEEE